MFRKPHLLPYLVYAALSLGLLSCGEDTETVQEPTTGVVTTVSELGPDDWKITDETTVADPAATQMIMDPINGPNDTLNLAQLKQLETADSTDYSSTQRRAYRRGGTGLLWFMVFNRMGGHRINRGAYANAGTYSRSAGAAGTMAKSARTTTRTRTGFGSKTRTSTGSRSGGSTRSFGG